MKSSSGSKTLIRSTWPKVRYAERSKDRFAIYNSDLYGKLWEDESLVKQT